MTGIERLRELSKGMHNHGMTVWQLTDDAYEERFGVTKHGPTIKNFLSDIADQIEREADVETVRSDAMEAWRWVCDHGGLENVRDAWDEAVNLCATIGCEPNDESEMLQALGDCTDIVIKRLMPGGLEWPRYESGEPVPIVGAIADELGRAHEVTSVEVFDNGSDLRWNPDEPEDCVWVGHGERVRRPAPKVLDADGVEVEVGDDLYSLDGMDRFHVSAIDRKGGRIATIGMFALDTWTDPKMYTHRAPVLAADGEPLEFGQTVHGIGRSQHEFEVLALNDVNPEVGDRFNVKCFDKDENEECWCDPRLLTHAKPEPPDSWERIEEDKGLNPFDYCEKVGHKLWTFDNAEEVKASDLVRRCRALAERERGE